MGRKHLVLDVKLGAGRLKNSGVSEELEEVKLAAWVPVRLGEGCACVPGMGRRGWD